MDEILDDIREIVVRYFDENIVNEEAYSRSDKIRLAIAQFTEWKFDWKDRKIFEDFFQKFPDFRFDNQTHFYKNDRCLKFHAEKSEAQKTFLYTVVISIFGFFAVYRQDYERGSDGSYIIDDTIFLERNSDNFSNSIYQVVSKYYPSLIWLPNKILLMQATKLNLPNFKFRDDILLVDLLFLQTR